MRWSKVKEKKRKRSQNKTGTRQMRAVHFTNESLYEAWDDEEKI